MQIALMFFIICRYSDSWRALTTLTIQTINGRKFNDACKDKVNYYEFV